jgi:DNA-binding MarR family transcriptional regulator
MNRFVRGGNVDAWVNLTLTVPQLKCLCYISRHGKINLSGLAAGIKVTPANVTGIVERLVEQGMLTRVPDTGDRRILWLRVTDKGESLLSGLREGRAGKMRELLERLSMEELSEVDHAMSILAGAAKAIERGEG